MALFDLESGNRIAAFKTGYRVTEACYNTDGSQLVLVGAEGSRPAKRTVASLTLAASMSMTCSLRADSD